MRNEKQSRKKKLIPEKTAQQRKTARSKKARVSAPVAKAPRQWDVPLLFLLLIIVAIPVLGPTPQVQGLAWIIRLSFLLPVLPLLLLVIGHKKSAITISTQPVMLALWALVFLSLISVFWAVNSYGAISGSLKWLYVLLMSVAVYSLARDDADSLRKIMIACALAGGYMAFIGVTQYLFGHEVYVTPMGQYPWPSATSGHKNMASQFVVVTLPFALYLSLTAKKPMYWLANPLIAMMLAYIVYGRARQVFVALMVQLLIILLALGFRHSRRLLAARSPTKDYYLSVAAALVLFLTLVFAPPFDKPFSWEKTAVSEFVNRTEVFAKEDVTLEQMSNGRVATWMITANMIRSHPMGVGLSNWTVHYPKFNAESGVYYRPPTDDVWGDAHNDYLQLLAELGLPFLLIAGLMTLGLWKIYRLIWTKGDETSQRHSLFIGLGLMGLFTVMMFSFPLTRTATPIMLGTYLGLLSAMAAVSLSPKAEKRIAFNPAVLSVLLLVSTVGAYFSHREVSAWGHGFLAKTIGEQIFKPGDNNPFATQRNKLLLAQHTDEALSLEPYASLLLRDGIVTYTNLSLIIDHERLAETYRKQALDAATRHLATSPNDSKMHMVVATRLQVPNDVAIEHVGKAIELDPANLRQYEYLKSFILPTKQFDLALGYYEYYIPRFFNQKMIDEYAYFGQQAGQQQRVIETLRRVDLARHFAPASAEYDAAKNRLEQLVDELQN